MEMVNYTLENMLGIDGIDDKFEIEVPFASVGILNAAKQVYNYVFKYFEDVNNINKFNKVLDRIQKLSLGEYRGIVLNARGEDLLKNYRESCDENKIKVALEKNDEEGILSIFYSILFFSFFAYNNELNDENNSCFLYKKAEDFDGYVFKEDNALFKFFNRLKEGWELNEYSISINNGNTTNVKKLKELLLSGTYKGIYRVFDTKEKIKDFVYSSFSSKLSFVTIQNDDCNFILNYGEELYSKFINRIYETLRAKAEETQKSAGYSDNKEDSEIIFPNNNILWGSTSRYDDIIKKYDILFNYAVALLKKYVEILKNDKELDATETKKALYKDNGLVSRLINKIVGVDADDDNYSFSKSSGKKIYEFDYSEKGSSIIDTIKIKTGENLDSDTTADVKDSPGKSLYNLEKSKCSQIFWNVKKSKLESEKKKIENIINKLNKDTKNIDSFFFYELEYFSDIFDKENFDLENKSKEDIEGKIEDLLKISSNIIYKICIFCLYDLEKTNDYKINQQVGLSYTNYAIITCDSRSYKLKKIFVTEGSKGANYNGTNYDSVDKLYENVGPDIAYYLNSIIKIEATIAENKEKIEQVESNYREFKNYILDRLKSGYYTEKDYFYINDNGVKRMPVNSFVDVEFRVPIYNSKTGNYESEWLPVTAVRTSDVDSDIVFNEQSDFNKENYDDKELEMHAGTYFDSMELDDDGGVKKISLTLKSSNDMNLERIIYNSLSLESKLDIYNGKGINSDQNIIADIEKIIKDNASSNFRVRFGYRDIASNDSSNNETTITSSNVSDNDFINRTRTFKQEEEKYYVKPVMVYPWTYFKITGLESNIKDGEDTYNITGVSSGAYILDNMSLCGIPSNFSYTSDDNKKGFLGTPRNVIGKLAKWIMMASADNINGENKLTTARICFLGDKEGTIINDVEGETNSEKFITNYRYILRGSGTSQSNENNKYGNENKYLRGGNIESIEPYFFNGGKNQDILKAKNFNIQNDKKNISVKTILDELIKWLPTRVYYIAHSETYNSVIAVYLPYETIYDMPDFFEKCPHKTERIAYQIIEADAHIYEGNEKTFSEKEKEENDFYHKVYFIRMYYEGPSRSVDANDTENKIISNDYLRIYNYRSLQEQVIENIDITCENEFGNTISSVSLLGSGTPMTFAFDVNNGVMNEDPVATNTKETVSKSIKTDKVTTLSHEKYSNIFNPTLSNSIKPFFALNNSQYIITDAKGVKNTPTTLNTYTLTASHFFSDMQNKLYSGEMTILGDPFYYFDSSVEAGKYEIYLQMNRAENQKTYKMVPSRYTGIYYIKGIKHNIDSSGKYTTTLSIFKRIFTGND